MRLCASRGRTEGRDGMARPSRASSSRLLISIRGSMAIAYCVGTLDRLTVEELLDRTSGLAAQGVKGFVCSLERVSHIHFHAFDPLLRLHLEIESRGGKIVFTDASPYLRQILDFGGVPRRVAVVDDKHEAVWSLLHAEEALAAQHAAS